MIYTNEQLKQNLKFLEDEEFDKINVPIRDIKLEFPEEFKEIKKNQNKKDWMMRPGNKENYKKYMKEYMKTYRK